MRPGRADRAAHSTVPFLPIRRAYVDVLDSGRRKNLMHGFVQLDVTDARRLIREAVERGEARPSFTAFLTHCVARAVAEHPGVHAYRRRGRLVLFEDVDVNLQVAVEHRGQQIVRSMLLRGAQRSSVAELTAAIRAAQAEEADEEHRTNRRYRGARLFAAVPRPLRALAWRAVMADPFTFKRLGGTVGVSSVGMFGSGGWGLVAGPPSLMVTVGGIERVPRLRDGALVERELLCVTLSFDHAVVDGAPAARFTARLAELVGSATGLTPGGTRPAARAGRAAPDLG